MRGKDGLCLDDRGSSVGFVMSEQHSGLVSIIDSSEAGES